MKKLILLSAIILSAFVASAQISIGVAGNYYKFCEDYLSNTPGWQLRSSYEFSKKFSMTLSYSSAFQINKSSSFIVFDPNNEQLSTVASEKKINSKTVLLSGNYTFLGTAKSKAKFYGTAGLGISSVCVSETNTEPYDKNIYVPVPGPENRGKNLFKYAVGVGGEYKIGTPSLFGEINYANSPDKLVSEACENYYPGHMLFSLGIKMPVSIFNKTNKNKSSGCKSKSRCRKSA
jgi:hypothetical protein